MTINLRDAAQYYQRLPHQQAAFDWLQGQIPADKLTEFAKRYRATPPKPAPETSYMLMTRTGQQDQYGGELFSLQLCSGSKVLESMSVISGAPGKAPVPVDQDYSGSMRPCPQGRFKLGGVERGNWGEAIGSLWISVYGTEPNRSAIGLHLDANRSYSPGSAGCVCPLVPSDMERVARWRAAGADVLVVDHGFKPSPER